MDRMANTVVNTAGHSPPYQALSATEEKKRVDRLKANASLSSSVNKRASRLSNAANL